jgi:hypothetical protein
VCGNLNCYSSKLDFLSSSERHTECACYIMPHDIHIIRLRGPWQLEPLRRYINRGDGCFDRSVDGLPHSARAKMPADWAATLGADFRGLVRYRRTFHQPTDLEPHEQVWLVVEPPRSHGAVRLGGKLLGEVVWGGPAGRFDITALLADNCTLEIDVAHPLLDEQGRPPDDGDTSAPGGLIGEVRLEIEE